MKDRSTIVTICVPVYLQSHAKHEAHWDGACGLTPEQRQALLRKPLTDSSEDVLSEGLQDLSTS